jgi:hypothetical protein
MSLGTWFRDYVYIPLGGNRVSKSRWFFNILAVWFLTGFWHGADWTFIVWGLFFAFLLLMEIMTKTYKSASIINFPLTIGGSYRRIKFQALTSGGSIYSTSDEAEIKALEAHHYMDKLYKLEQVQENMAIIDRINGEFDGAVESTAQEYRKEKAAIPAELRDAVRQERKLHINLVWNWFTAEQSWFREWQAALIQRLIKARFLREDIRLPFLAAVLTAFILLKIRN